ncbi:DUF2321 domain-containing protein [Phenylobacterium sp. Root700]|uniref:DUF2321 domain-containing protein n=1 Tax=Phenylobacterium sp. Root700 TaxID=1736591 RepID=UPI0006FB6C86|nr:DUF2321 domain-containing protein [Phenylobacterium sp. Root700]KRB42058.1 hypothetical protein ASE02_04400 [Phenylobacterium sp. Root700]
MGTYRVAQVCPNGHVATSSADQYRELREEFCSKCGEATTTACPGCNASIRGYYYVEGVLSIGREYEPPAFCHACGKPFPWTERKVAAAVELVEVGGDLSSEEVAQFRSDLNEMTKDSPKTQIASLRFKKVMAKVGGGVASGVRDIVIDVLSETAKKAIWGA